ncbi:fibrinogen C domain-containing protein 1-like isoform X2 [Watersipora subatra]|uniref:fibrinogen C domain-containing protein 1-like isoform X2 n=1 Tax=Watersipora subatra TaxID=2589382 RepID=UPI00355BAE84
MALLSSLALLIILISASDARLIGVSEKGQTFFRLRQSIYAARQLLQNECPTILEANHGIYDDSAMPFHFEVSEVIHSKLLDGLTECLTVRTTARSQTTLPSSNQSLTTEEAASTQPTSKHLTTDEPTNAQSVTSEMPKPQDCQELYERGNRCPGVYQVNPPHTDGEPFPVWCDFIDGRGWTVFQRRVDGSVDFSKNWTDYQTGFGEIDREHWLGLDKIHALTRSNTKLFIFLRAANGTTESGIWPTFYINGLADGYRLTISNDGYRGSLDSYGLDHHHGMKFSTPDHDQDNSGGNCAQYWEGGWWFTNCHESLLNGVYGAENQGGIMWRSQSNHFSESVMRVTRD